MNDVTERFLKLKKLKEAMPSNEELRDLLEMSEHIKNFSSMYDAGRESRTYNLIVDVCVKIQKAKDIIDNL